MYTLLKKAARILIPVSLMLSCSTENKVSVTATNFETEIETLQNLAFTFDRDLAPDSVLNIWDTTAYLEFSPAINGAFKWVSSKELIFSPSSAFQSATEYTTQLNNELTRFSRVKTIVDDLEKFKLHTPYLDVESSNGWWSP